MTYEETVQKLAAFFFYAGEATEKGVSFEALDEDKKKPFVALAITALIAIGKMNLQLVPVPAVPVEQSDKILKDKLEATVRDFFAGIRVWKKDAIPQEELVARVWQIWKTQ